MNRKVTTIIVTLLMTATLAMFGCSSSNSSIQYSFDSSDTQQRHWDMNAESDAVLYEWVESDAPNYYLVVGEADFYEEPTEGVTISGLDSLGRTQSVSAIITYDMVEESAGWREEFKRKDNPSGWPIMNKETDIELADGSFYHGWFWNRSHLLADSLGGHAVKENAITGTRMQNVGDNSKNPGGMAYIESKVRNYIYDNPTITVSYEATPIYNNDEFIPRSVVVNALSSDGIINEKVVVYNTAKGYDVDYYDGTFTSND